MNIYILADGSVVNLAWVVCVSLSAGVIYTQGSNIVTGKEEAIKVNTAFKAYLESQNVPKVV